MSGTMVAIEYCTCNWCGFGRTLADSVHRLGVGSDQFRTPCTAPSITAESPDFAVSHHPLRRPSDRERLPLCQRVALFGFLGIDTTHEERIVPVAPELGPMDDRQASRGPRHLRCWARRVVAPVVCVAAVMALGHASTIVDANIINVKVTRSIVCPLMG